MTRHRHPVNVPLSAYKGADAASMIVTDQALPLAHDLTEGGAATPANSSGDWLECLTCHRAHGTSAVMTGWASNEGAANVGQPFVSPGINSAVPVGTAAAQQPWRVRGLPQQVGASTEHRPDASCIGRAGDIPGPSSILRAEMKRANDILLGALLVIGLAGWFLLSTVLADEVPDAWLVATAALGACALSAASGWPRREDFAAVSAPDVVLTAVAGVLALVVAPALVLANRFTDAPPGSEVLFFTTAVWGALALLVALASAADRPRLAQASYALAGVVGAATLVANWERPSSFSPFVRYPSSHAAFIVAGLAWMVATLVIVRQSRRAPEATLLMASGAGALAGLVWALATAPSIAGLTDSVVLLLAAAACAAVTFVAWVRLAGSDFSAPAGLWFLAPVVVAGFGVFEQVVNPRGPDPVVWAGASVGIALCVVGAFGVAASSRRGAARDAARAGMSAGGSIRASQAPTRRFALASAALAGTSLAAALISLALPALGATVRGTNDGAAYVARWNLLGYETAVGWLAVVAAALLLTAAVDVVRDGWRRGPMMQGVIGAALVACYPLVVSTPLRTWNRWVPVAIQSEYGTEYASLQFSVVHQPVRVAALVLTVAAAAVLLVGAVDRTFFDHPRVRTVRRDTVKRPVLIGIIIAVLVAVAVGYFALSGCERTVSVENGVRVVCTYGHTVSDSVKTIEVPASQASNYSVQTKTITCPKHQQAEKLYGEAQAALAKADLKAAAASLKKVIALDAGFRQAKAQLAEIEAGKKPKPDTAISGGGSPGSSAGGSGAGGSAPEPGSGSSEPSGTADGGEKPGTTPGTPGDDVEPEGPVASLRKWLPDDIKGYAAEPLTADAFVLTRNYAPSGGPKTKQLVIAAEQLGNADKVDAALEANIKLLYTRGCGFAEGRWQTRVRRDERPGHRGAGDRRWTGARHPAAHRRRWRQGARL